MYAQVQVLFNGAQDLLQEFKHFLPDPASGPSGRLGYSRGNVCWSFIDFSRLAVVVEKDPLQAHTQQTQAMASLGRELERRLSNLFQLLRLISLGLWKNLNSLKNVNA